MDAMLAGRFADAYQAMQEARLSYEVIDNSYGKRGALMLLGYIALGQGHLQQADRLFRQVLETAGEDRADRGIALVGRATLAYEWNQLAAAEQDAQQANTLSQELGYELLQIMATLILARVLHTRGHPTQAHEILQHHAASPTEPRWLHEIETWQAWLAYASGDLATMQRWDSARRTAVPEQALTEAQQEREALLDVRLLIAHGQAQAALGSLDRWRAAARSQTRARSEMEILILMARAHFRAQRTQATQQALIEALALAPPAGYQRLFLDEGVDLIALLKATLPSIQEKPLLAYARSLLHTFGQEHSASTPAAPLVELLSPQEQRVLRLLVAGRSNPEIARELIVSINTVKAQVKSIYRKLGVGSRLEASDVVRQLHLL